MHRTTGKWAAVLLIGGALVGTTGCASEEVPEETISHVHEHHHGAASVHAHGHPHGAHDEEHSDDGPHEHSH
jgi:hypothetical protein